MSILTSQVAHPWLVRWGRVHQTRCRVDHMYPNTCASKWPRRCASVRSAIRVNSLLRAGTTRHRDGRRSGSTHHNTPPFHSVTALLPGARGQGPRRNLPPPTWDGQGP